MEYTKGEWKARRVVEEELWIPCNNIIVARTYIADGNEEANAHLIAAAVNACVKLNPENPMAVAETMSELVEALKEQQNALSAIRQIMPLMFNISKPEEEKAWELWRDSCIKAEWALAKVKEGK